MKTLLFAATVASCVLTAGSALAAEHIKVKVAGAIEGNCTNDLGWVVEAGDDRDAVASAVEKQAREKFPKARTFANKDNDKKGKSLGTHLVILEVVQQKGECTEKRFGVGFGRDAAAATKDARRDLGKRAPWWNGEKFEVVHDKAY